MNPRLLAAAERLYRTLTLMPCTCSALYSGGRFLRLTRDCRRCRALIAWEQAQEPSALPPACAAAEAALAELEEHAA